MPTADVHLVWNGTGVPVGTERRRDAVEAAAPRRAWRHHLLALGAVAAATALAHLAFRETDRADIVMVYVLATVLTAARWGRGPSLLASVLSVAAFDYFFIPPLHTFAVKDVHHLGTFGVLLFTGWAIGTLSERVRHQTRVAEARELRNTLLSSVSHDLRTPLGAITGAASTLLQEGIPEETRRELVQGIQDEAQRMHRLVTNLLDLTRLEAGGLALDKVWTPLEEVVGSALNRMEAVLAAHPVSVALPEELPLVPLDEVLLEQALVNLLDNAAKHTPPGTAVEVAAWREGGAVVLAVSDRGPGIPAGEEERVFDKLVRGSRNAAGAGLGLAICRAVAEVHGGSAWAEARPGGGARFLLSLPLGGEPPALPEEAE